MFSLDLSAARKAIDRVQITGAPRPFDQLLGKALQAVSAGKGQVSWGGPLRILAALDLDPKCGYTAFCEVVGRDPFFLVGRTPNPAFTPAQLPQWTLAVVTEVDLGLVTAKLEEAP